MSAERPTAPEPDWERLQRAAKVYGAAMHKAGQEEVRRSEYRERAQELMLAARDELDAAFRDALGGSRTAPEPSDQLNRLIGQTAARFGFGSPPPLESMRASGTLHAYAILRSFLADAAELSGSRPTAPEPSEAAIAAGWKEFERITYSPLPKQQGGYTPSRGAFEFSLRAAYAVDALGGSPQPPAGDPSEDEEESCAEAKSRLAVYDRIGLEAANAIKASDHWADNHWPSPADRLWYIAAQEEIKALRAALRGGSHQPEER